MLRGKQKRYLRSLGVNLDPSVQIGKGGISENVINQTLEGLVAHELIKGRVLETAPQEAAEVGATLAEATGAELVQVIGRNFLLYKRNEKEPRITLPK